MNRPPGGPGEPSVPGGFTAADLTLLRRIAAGNDWLRSVLCTLARRGTALRHADPARAEAWIEALRPWPWYKGGQFLFDLLEWEDFMVDGPPPEPLATVLTGEVWAQLREAADRLRALIDAMPAPSEPEGATPISGGFHDDADLPPLEPGLHLYRDVVLGVVVSAPTLPSSEPAP